MWVLYRCTKQLPATPLHMCVWGEESETKLTETRFKKEKEKKKVEKNIQSKQRIQNIHKFWW